MLFEKLGLSAELLRAIDEQGYREATPIQQQAIPLILEGRDVLAGAQTGTGKTAGFTLPLLQRLQAVPDQWTTQTHPRPDTDPDARTRRTGQRERSRLRPPSAVQDRGNLWRRQHQSAEIQIAKRRRHRRRHARSPARSRPAENHRSVRRRNTRAGRSRSNARHGIYQRHSQDSRPDAEAAPESAVLGDLLK